jgi:predicted 3-demethylubiquinone-9 3-methyltransferase (glyoxalase superfamily)
MFARRHDDRDGRQYDLRPNRGLETIRSGISQQLKGNDMQKITPCLWFNDNAEEAVSFYTSIFKNSKIKTITRYGDAGAEASGRPKGAVMTVTFELDGQEFMALNGGPHFTFSPAISFMANCNGSARQQAG